MGKHNKITEQEIELVKNNWGNSSLEEMKQLLPHRSVTTLYSIAKLAGVSCEYRQRQSNMAKLLDDSNDSWYWLGFILADGHISKRGQLSIMLSDYDEDHLTKFAQYIGSTVIRPYNNPNIVYTNRYTMDADKSARSMVRVSSRNIDIAPKISTLLGLKDSNKTINPPTKLHLLDQRRLECLFIGFFDGDGSMPSAKIECHKSWLVVFELFQSNGLLMNTRINARGYVCATVPLAVRNRLRLIDVPKLDRKWPLPLTDEEKFIKKCNTRNKQIEAKNSNSPYTLNGVSVSIKEASRILGVKYRRLTSHKERHPQMSFQDIIDLTQQQVETGTIRTRK